tara:strand:+ start:173 stop:1471 length:1299 start_codon:yes stop_codon:yes gene_type:complete
MKRTRDAAAIWTTVQTLTTANLHTRRTKITRLLANSSNSAATTTTKKDKWASSSDEDEDEDIQDLNRKTNSSSSSSSATNHSTTNHSTSSHIQTARSIDRYQKIKAIGEGQYGTVWMAKRKLKKKQNKANAHQKRTNLVALKQIKLTSDISGAEGFPSTALREINVLQSLHHPNIIKVHEVVVGTTTDQIYIVMDYVPVELGTLMVSMGETPFSISDSKCLIVQLLDAIEYMHERLFIHRDIKPTNILYHGNGSNIGKLILCDFGLAKRISKPQTVNDPSLTPVVVTLYYRALEILLGDGCYDEAVDVWSIGCVFAEMILNKVLIQGKGEIDQISKIFSVVGAPNDAEIVLLNQLSNGSNMNWKEIQKNNRKGSMCEVLHVLGEQGLDFLQKMFCYDPTLRMTAKEAKGHVFLSSNVTELKDMPKVLSETVK